MCTDLLAFALLGEENLEPSDEGCIASHRFKWVPYLQMRSIGSHSTSEMQKEGKDETERAIVAILFFIEPWIAA